MEGDSEEKSTTLQVTRISLFIWLFLCLLGGPIAIITLVGLLFTKYYTISLAYGLYLWYDWKSPDRGGWKWRPIARWTVFTTLLPNYFPVHIESTVSDSAFDAKNKNYIFGFHPHGTIPMTVFCGGWTKEKGFMDRLGLRPTLVGLGSVFAIPFLREWALGYGGMAASHASIDHVLSGKEGMGQALAIIVGGAAEVFHSEPFTMRIVLKNRFGFVRKALKHGADLVPCVTFGDNEVFHRVYFTNGSFAQRLQSFFIRLGIPILSFHGEGWAKVMPRRLPMSVFVGAPIHVDKNPEATEEDVKKLHTEYVEAVVALYEEKKASCGYGNVPLEFV